MSPPRNTDPPDGTVAWKLHQIQKRIPPLEGVRSRNGYISNVDLAKRMGWGGSSVTNWKNSYRTGRNYPDKRSREAWAALSEGLYEPDDLIPTAEELQTHLVEHRLAQLEGEVVRARDLAPWLRVVRLLAQGRIDEARRELPEAGESP